MRSIKVKFVFLIARFLGVRIKERETLHGCSTSCSSSTE